VLLQPVVDVLLDALAPRRSIAPTS